MDPGRFTDEEGEAAPAPVTVDLDKPCLTHPCELRLDSRQAILLVAALTPDSPYASRLVTQTRVNLSGRVRHGRLALMR